MKCAAFVLISGFEMFVWTVRIAAAHAQRQASIMPRIKNGANPQSEAPFEYFIAEKNSAKPN
jgi:hypothetical protein